MTGTVLWDGVGRSAQPRTLRPADHARGWGERRMVGPWGGQSGLLRCAVRLVVEAGCQGRRRCGAAGPGPGVAQDERQEQHLKSDAEAAEEGPGLTGQLEGRVG